MAMLKHPYEVHGPPELIERLRAMSDRIERACPGDVSPPNFDVLLPVIPNAETPQAGWIVRDDAARRFAVSALDSNAQGWRLQVRLLAAA